jgi:aryl-alcohol dehydrogenase-like predicted oxidoreductase
MKARRLGTTPLSVSVLGLGCNNFGARLDFAGTRLVVHAALDAGITFFDTADAYGDGESERFLGRLLADRRSDVVIATKFGWGAGPDDGAALGAPEAVRAAVASSLERLQTDYIDLYYYHRPDGITPIAQTLGALHELMTEGVIRYAGCSNFSADGLVAAEAAAAEAGTGFAALQNEYNLLNRAADDELLPLCGAYGIAFIPYRPLAQGLLTGKYRQGAPPPEGARLQSRPGVIGDGDLERVERLDRFARERGQTLLELAIAGLASQPQIASVIAGAMTEEQVAANVAATAWELTDADLAELRSLTAPRH